MKNILFLAFFFFSTNLFSQVTTDPAIPNESSEITIIFNASEGSGGLAGFTGDVYAHTGVITSESTSDSDWKYVVAGWGVNVPKAKLTRDANNPDLYTLVIGNPREYYGVTSETESIEKLAFVFRSATAVGGTWREGKTSAGGDIFVELAQGSISAVFEKPNVSFQFLDANSQLEVVGIAAGADEANITLTLFNNNVEVASVNGLRIEETIEIGTTGGELKLKATDSQSNVDSAIYTYVIRGSVVTQARPNGLEDGLTIESTTSASFSLFAPYKESVYLIGDFNDWTPSAEYQLKKDVQDDNNVWFWTTISGLDPNTEYAYQYLVDETIRTADPYSTLILDPWNDGFIPESHYPNLKPYPTGKTERPVSVFQTNEEEYTWTTTNYERPPKEEIIVYELLVRDFVEESHYRTLIDTLDYLQNLGINAIEFMPVSEFDGNDSWGYNPGFHMALDKYYGTENDFKAFIDACHSRGIAVIIDLVFNHATGLSPLIEMYWDSENNRPAANSPYAFQSERHPFNVFNDLNHGSAATNRWMKKVIKYWMEEFKLDGFRFDLSKGHYIGNTTDTGVWSSRDQWRIDHWKDNYNYMMSIDNSFYVILEHLGANNEEKELADYGMMFWGKMTSEYNEMTMGYHDGGKSNVDWGYYKSRGWNDAHLVSYMESHDEERLMFKNLRFGNVVDGYSIKDLPTALDRVKSAGAFFYTIPGPKMLWQFGELGYDVSIEQSEVGGPLDMDRNRVSRKPILWEYYEDESRFGLYTYFSALLKMRSEEIIFRDPNTNVDLQTSGSIKRIFLERSGERVAIIGNFGMSDTEFDQGMPANGTWYDFFGQESISVSDNNYRVSLDRGEVKIFSTKQFAAPDTGTNTSNEDVEIAPEKFALLPAYPNPFNPTTTIRYQLAEASQVRLEVFDQTGRRVASLADNAFRAAGMHEVRFDASALSSGIYLVRMVSAGNVFTQKLTLLK